MERDQAADRLIEQRLRAVIVANKEQRDLCDGLRGKIAELEAELAGGAREIAQLEERLAASRESFEGHVDQLAFGHTGRTLTLHVRAPSYARADRYTTRNVVASHSQVRHSSQCRPRLPTPGSARSRPVARH